MNNQEIKELWELCGLEQNSFGNWGVPDEDGILTIITGYNEYPPITPDNLFKYAVPKLPSDTFHINFVLVPAGYACDILTPSKQIGYGLSKDPAQALAQAILTVLKGHKK